MTLYERDLDNVTNNRIEVIDTFFAKVKGLSTRGWIAVCASLTTHEKRCILAEEYCHILFSIGDITDLSNTANRKQEIFARRKAYEMLVPMKDIQAAYNRGNTHISEIAEELEVSEAFLQEAIEHYKIKYGGEQLT